MAVVGRIEQQAGGGPFPSAPAGQGDVMARLASVVARLEAAAAGPAGQAAAVMGGAATGAATTVTKTAQVRSLLQRFTFLLDFTE